MARPRWLTLSLGKRRDAILGSLALALLLVGLTVYVFYPAWSGSRHWRQAEAALEDRDFDRAVVHLRKYVNANPSSGEGYFLLARTLRRAGRFDEAQIELSEARRLGWVPEQIELEGLLAQVQRQGARGPELKLLSQYLAAKHPDDRVILEALFLGDRSALELHQARHWLDVWVERYPDDWAPRLWRGQLLESFTHFDMARDDYLKLRELKPDSDEALLRLGLLALNNRANYAEAESYLRQYLERHPDDTQALLGLARARRDQGELKAAADAAQKVLARQPDHPEAVLLVGTLKAEEGQSEEALDWLRRAERLGADPQAVHFQLARVLTRLNRPTEAQTHERKFQELEKASQAVDKALSALLQDPRNPDIYLEVARQYLVMGQETQAERWFAAALTNDPAHRKTHEALAEYYTRRARPGDEQLAAQHRRLAAP